MTDFVKLGAAIEALKTAGVAYLLPQFVDLHGSPKGKLVPIAQWQSVYEGGAGFAGPSIDGTGLGRTGDYSEYYGRGDAQRKPQQLPWNKSVARVVCNAYVNNAPFANCPRAALAKQTARLAKLGLSLNVGIEPEFFLFKAGTLAPSNAGDALPKPSYDLQSLLDAPVQNCLAQLHTQLSELGFDVVQIDHEDAPAQYELNYTYSEALAAADQFTLFKLAAHDIARAHGFDFSLMPKPFADRPGSGLHFHLSLADTQGNNAFASADKTQLLSPMGQHALAGMLKHAPALTALHASTVNSYKRLVIGQSLSGTTWAPAHIAHGYNNRTVVARTLAGRFEWRLPDGLTNVYLALAGVIAAMLDGIENELPLAKAVDADVYEWDAAKFSKEKIKHLPQDLSRALDAFEADTALTEALGSSISSQYLALKRSEWVEFARSVSSWELAQYARRL